MATTAREGSNGRERRVGVSSSSPPLTKKTTKSPSSASCSDQKTSLTSSTRRPVPNYLRPTASSRKETSSLARRPTTEASVQRPSLDRRRSFDRPPSSVRLQKAVQGSIPGASLREKPVRSTPVTTTSRSTLPSSSRSVVPDRPSRTIRRDTKVEPSSSSVKPKTIRRSTTFGGSRSDGHAKVGGLLKKKAPKSVTSEPSVEAHDRDLRFGHVSEDEGDSHEIQSLPDISEMPGDEEQLGDPDIVTDLKVLEQHKAVAEEKMEEHQQYYTHFDPDMMQKSTDGESEDHTNEKHHSIDKHLEEDIEQLSDCHQVETEPEEEISETKETGKEESVKDEEKEEELSEEDNKEGGEETDNADDEAKPEAQNLSPLKQPGSAGKKEAQAYNDVIEETAAKLMERKNKVRALAGAFETVISLQETK